MTPDMSQLPDRADLIGRFQADIGRRPSAHLGALALLLIALIGLADHLTGYDVSFGLFYLAPVSLMAWYVSRRAGTLTACLSAAVWLLANSLTAPPGIPPTIIVWNTMIRFGFFEIIAVLVAAVGAAHDREKLLARTDQLTGLMNGRAFRELADRELMRARRVGHSVTLLYLDLDNFKNVNDRRGHAAGDELLGAFARVLESVVRATDLVGRLGGDEFVVLLPDTSAQQGSLVAAKINQAISADERFARDGVSASVGAATSGGITADLEDLVAAADTAMYEAKSTRAHA